MPNLRLYGSLIEFTVRTARSAHRSLFDVTICTHSMPNSSLPVRLVKSQTGCALIRRQAAFRTRSLLHKVTTFAATMGLIAAMVAGQPHSVSAANGSELWFVVHDLCLPAYRSIGVAFPCAEVNIANGLDRGFVVLRAPSSAAHVIVVPTARIDGIESPALQSENAPNYWAAAWDARRFVEEGARHRLLRDKWQLGSKPQPRPVAYSCRLHRSGGR
jgi:CDP-diacylglycerol pyrophosphatase